jgi:phage gpG-like protein
LPNFRGIEDTLNKMGSKTNGSLKISASLQGLQKILEAKDRYVKVGVIGSNASKQHSDSPYTNAEIGLIHEFGSLTRNIPRRSFLRMPIIAKKDKIKSFVEKNKGKMILAIQNDDKKSINNIMKKLGMLGESIVQEAFDTRGFGTWQELSPITIKAKNGSTAILIDKAELRGSITSEVIS